MKCIYDYTIKELEEYLINNNEKKFKAQQIYSWLYKKRVNSFDKMSNLSKDTIKLLNDNFYFNKIVIEDKLISQDKTIKYLFKLEDNNVIETVLMRYEHGYSICVSSQVGCNMACQFCASGKLKKIRDLETYEMLLQVLIIQQELDNINERVSNIVVMGIGEPFDNYNNVLSFIEIVNNDNGLQIGARRITISTCGLIDEIERLSNEKMQINLAISLHSANNNKRSKIMPINIRYDLNELKKVLLAYQKKTNRRITLEYILFKGFNDHDDDIKKLKTFIKGLNAYVNLIPYNDTNDQRFKSITRNDCYPFYQRLKDNNINVTIRKDFGKDIVAACGQLRAQRDVE